MKKSIILLTTFLVTFHGIAQENAIDKHFQEYASMEAFTKVSISAKMFELFTYLDMENPEDQEVLNTIRNLKGMKMLICDSIASQHISYQKALTKPPKEYEVLMTIEDQGEDITFLIKENGGIVDELLLIGGSDSSLFVLTLFGKINLKQISKLAKHVNIEGLDHLQHVEDGK